MGVVGTAALDSRIRNVIQIHRDAEDVTNAEAIGVLELIKLEIYQDTLKEDKER